MPSPIQPRTRPGIDYPIEFASPDVGRWRADNSGTAGVHSFAAGGPARMSC